MGSFESAPEGQLTETVGQGDAKNTQSEHVATLIVSEAAAVC